MTTKSLNLALEELNQSLKYPFIYKGKVKYRYKMFWYESEELIKVIFRRVQK